jgi:hypothetical protein
MLPFFLVFRATVTLDSSTDFGYVANFGFDPDGAIFVTWKTLAGSVPLELLLLDYDTFVSWRIDRRSDSSWHSCSPVPSAGNHSDMVTPSPEDVTFQVTVGAVYYLIVVHCSWNSTSLYTVDAQFTNPDGQLLDSRYCPMLIFLPAAIPLYCGLLIGWVMFLRCTRSRFSPPRIYLGALIGAKILCLVLTETDLALRSETDSAVKFTDPARIAAQSLVTAMFLCGLVMTAGGWGIVRVRWRWPTFAAQIGLGALFVGSDYAVYYWALAFDPPIWIAIAAAAVQAVALVLLAIMVYRNWATAVDRLSAHLLVISLSGIRPTSTPVYARLTLYTWAIIITMAELLALSVCTLAWFWIVEWWVGHLVQDALLLVSCVALMWVVRAREADVYFESNDRGERKVVKLVEVRRFVPTDVSPEMKEWWPGMRLPPEPVLLAADVDTASECEYTRETEASTRVQALLGGRSPLI